MKEIKLHGVTKQGLKNIIDFIYTSKVSLDMGNLQDTLEAANFLQVMPVLKFCNQLLSREVRGFSSSVMSRCCISSLMEGLYWSYSATLEVLLIKLLAPSDCFTVP